jgi:hypothetical protein
VSAGRLPQRTRFHPERLLPFACIAAAVALLASELTTTFHFVPPGGEALCDQQASDRHHFALGVIALLAIGAVVVAVLGASRPAAISVAIAGVAALALFLVVDLPDANSIGTPGEECTSLPGLLDEAKAVPQAGFWLELAGALALAFSGAILATLTPDQLATLRPRRLGGRRGTTNPEPPADQPTRAPGPPRS